MRKATFCGLPHSESEVYYVKVSGIGRQPTEVNRPGFKAPAESQQCFLQLQHGKAL